MISMDLIAVGVAFFSFGIFLLAHAISFRQLQPERLLGSLLNCVIVTLLFPLQLTALLYFLNAGYAFRGQWLCAGLLASLIHGLLCFVYVLCVFGPYETSVRMRLVREIEKGGARGVSPEELSARYNARTIVDVRLQRLTGSGDVIEKDGHYRIGRAGNFFFVFDSIAGVLKKWIGRP